MSNILIRVNGHFFEWWDEAVSKNGGVYVLSGLSNDFGHAEFNVWNIILGSFKEDWDNMLGNLILHHVWHNCTKGVEATHSVVISFLVNGIVVDNNWNIFIHDPIGFESLSKKSTLLNTHLSNTGGSIGKVAHEDGLERLDEYVFSEY